MIELQITSATTRADVLGFIATIYNALVQNGYLQQGVSVVINNEAWTARSGIDNGIYLTCMSGGRYEKDENDRATNQSFWAGDYVDYVEYDLHFQHLRYNGDVGETVTPPLPECAYNYAVMNIPEMTNAIIRMAKNRYGVDINDCIESTP